jgi:hypothetical protein
MTTLTPVRYRAMRAPDGSMIYLADGISYASLMDLRAAYPGRDLERITASRKNRLFG